MEGIDDLLIATSWCVWAFQRGTLTRIHHGFGRYYGITWDEKYIYLVARRVQRLPRTEGTENILVLKPNFDWIGEFQDMDLFKLHQIHFFDGQLFICNTGRNRLDIVTSRVDDKHTTNPLGSLHYLTHRLNMDPDNLPGDSLWLNSVWANRDRIYVVEHRRGPSKVKYMNNKFELLGEETGLGERIHNVYVEDGKMIVCSSEAECIIIRDLSTGKDRAIDTSQYVKGLPRGLARTKDRWYIGISYRAVRGERHRGHTGYVLVFDDDFKLLKQITLKGVGQVCEIRAMTGIDRAHNGIPFPSPPSRNKLVTAYRPHHSQAHQCVYYKVQYNVLPEDVFLPDRYSAISSAARA
jgi:hypothetical protein